MNKKRIDRYITTAVALLKASKIVDENGKIPKTFRGYISSFGAAVVMGSLRSAVAFNSAQNGAELERQILIKLIYCLINDKGYGDDDCDILGYIIAQDNDEALKEKIYDAAIAVKLAMNAYDLESR